MDQLLNYTKENPKNYSIDTRKKDPTSPRVGAFSI
jgi:hypothetical protein